MPFIFKFTIKLEKITTLMLAKISKINYNFQDLLIYSYSFTIYYYFLQILFIFFIGYLLVKVIIIYFTKCKSDIKYLSVCSKLETRLEKKQ